MRNQQYSTWKRAYPEAIGSEGTYPSPESSRRERQFTKHDAVARARRAWDVAWPTVVRFVCDQCERDGFFGIDVDAEIACAGNRNLGNERGDLRHERRVVESTAGSNQIPLTARDVRPHRERNGGCGERCCSSDEIDR